MPLEEIYRTSYNEIEYLKVYLTHLSDTNTRQLFKDVMIHEIDVFQIKITEEYTLLFKETFPHRVNEALEITRRQREKTWEDVNGLLQKLDTLNWEIMSWVNRISFVDLSQVDIRGATLTKGKSLWTRQFQDLKKRIDEVLMQFTYKGHPLHYVGSLNNGTRGAHKGKTVININDFDVDLFVVHSVEWHRNLPIIMKKYPQNLSNGKIFPLGTHMQELQNLSHAVGQALAGELGDDLKNAWDFIDNTEIVLREIDSY